MRERQPVRVQRLSWELDRPQRVGPVGVALLADERVPAQARLDPDLIPFAGHETDLDQGSLAQRLDQAVVRHRLVPARIARVRLFLHQRLQIPDEVIAPRAFWRRRPAVHDGAIHAFRLVPQELFFQRLLRRFALRKQHQS